MGLAFIIPGADFSKRNLGTITPTSGNVIHIVGDSIVNGYAAYSLSDGSNAIWSIVSGGDYLTINASSGMAAAIGDGNATIMATINGETFTKEVTTVMDRGVILVKGGSGTPIVTNYTVSDLQNARMIALVGYGNSSKCAAMLGARSSRGATDTLMFSIAGSGNNYMLGKNSTGNNSTGINLNGTAIIRVSSEGANSNGTDIPFSTTGSIASSGSMPIAIGYGYNGSSYEVAYGQIKIGFFVILENGDLKAAFIPYYDESGNTYGWKDIISNTTYNASSNSIYGGYSTV